MATIRIKRGTRAQLEAAAGDGELLAGEPYLITDEDRIAVGTGTGAFAEFARVGEGGGPAPVDMSLIAETAVALGDLQPGRLYMIGSTPGTALSVDTSHEVPTGLEFAVLASDDAFVSITGPLSAYLPGGGIGGAGTELRIPAGGLLCIKCLANLSETGSLLKLLGEADVTTLVPPA